jgi:hypothetical protein
MGAFKRLVCGAFMMDDGICYLHHQAGWVHDWMGMGGWVDGIMKSLFELLETDLLCLDAVVI